MSATRLAARSLFNVQLHDTILPGILQCQNHPEDIAHSYMGRNRSESTMPVLPYISLLDTTSLSGITLFRACTGSLVDV